MTNTGTEYEILTMNIFKQIFNQKDVETINLQHNVTLPGKTTTHQIDVYWEFEFGGIKYITIVQSKDWNTSVNQGELLKFKGVIDDLPNQPRGIFVTRTGYQKGAKTFAENNGIILYELREPTEKDWEDRIETIIINLSVFTPHMNDINIQYDELWVKSEKKKLGIPNDYEFELSIDGDTVLLDENGNCVTTLSRIFNSLTPHNQKLNPTKKLHKFNQPRFIETDISEFPKLKLDALEFVMEVTEINEQIVLEAKPIVGFILKNVIENKEILADKTFKPLNFSEN